MAKVRASCPRCGRETLADDTVPLPPDFPFCSERCRLIDLGKWFDEDYRVSEPLGPVPAASDVPPPDEDDEPPAVSGRSGR